MSQLINNGTKWTGSIELAKRTGTIIQLNTNENYLDKNIELTVNALSATPAFSGGVASSQSIGLTKTNVVTSSTDTSGVSIRASVEGNVSAVTYDGTVHGWVNALDGDSAKAASSFSWQGDAQYITGVTIENGKSFDITVPNGSSGTITFHFAVDASGNTTIT